MSFAGLLGSPETQCAAVRIHLWQVLIMMVMLVVMMVVMMVVGRGECPA